ncbi:hypothetical protein Aazo_1786 ['Nostoc azollae' 0708]|jgi:hypothetical protein|uniref:Uncharacterized protein n=1 Tax=Nostoc azollae (strain 0708) TaxID=551115 RepID=D7DVQ0_NOSA0|nr:hypothetical protein Aazo_1786 ['Nostoc azollae' 0708]
MKNNINFIHKVYLGFNEFFSLLTVYPTSMIRISQKEKFKGCYVKSLRVEGEYYSESVK